MPPMMHGATGGGMSSAIADKEAEHAREIHQALKQAFDEIDEDGGGTLDKEELVQMFAGKGISAADKDVDDLIRAANGCPLDEDVSELDVTFDAFSRWMQSSSPLANEMRHVLGGSLENKLDMDAMGIEERELWAKREKGWIYPGGSPRRTTFILLEEANSSRMAKAISLLMMTLIAFSTTMFVLESVDSIQQKSPQAFVIAETGCILSFTLEYLLRMWSCVERPYRDKQFLTYFATPMNIVDIVAILPFYLELLLQAGGSFGVIRVLRLARVFRVLKVGSMSSNLAVVAEGLSRSISGLTVLVYLLALFIVISSAVMHMVEWDPVECAKEEPNETVSPCTVGFDTIPDSTWFVMVTMTSVGYGDYSPSGDIGKFVASVIMISGVLAIAIPITLIGNKFNQVWLEAQVEAGAKQARNTMRMSISQNGVSGGDVTYDDVGGQYNGDLRTIDAVFEVMPPGKFQREHLGIIWYRGKEVSTGNELVLLRTILSRSHAALLPHFAELQHDTELHNERLQLNAINGELVSDMPYEAAVEKANTAARPLTLQLVERYRTDVVAHEQQVEEDCALATESTLWSIQALLSEAVVATEGASPQLAALTRMMSVVQMEQDSTVQRALTTLLETAEEEQAIAEQSGAEELDAATLLRRAAAAEQRNEKRRQRNAAALADMDDSGDVNADEL